MFRIACLPCLHVGPPLPELQLFFDPFCLFVSFVYFLIQDLSRSFTTMNEMWKKEYDRNETIENEME